MANRWGVPPTEVEMLRESLAEAQGELRRRDMDEARARIAAADAAKAAEDAEHVVVTEQASAAELESYRRAAWMNLRIDQALAEGNDAFVSFLSGPQDRHVPAEGWPEGVTPEQFNVVGIPEPEPGSSIAGTLLGSALAKAGVKI